MPPKSAKQEQRPRNGSVSTPKVQIKVPSRPSSRPTTPEPQRARTPEPIRPPDNGRQRLPVPILRGNTGSVQRSDGKLYERSLGVRNNPTVHASVPPPHNAASEPELTKTASADPIQRELEKSEHQVEVKLDHRALSKMRDPEFLGKAMEKMNDYLQAIMSPMRVVGARIPQGANIPTFTFQALKRFTASTTGGGDVKFQTIGLIIGSWVDSGVTASNFAGYIPQPNTTLTNPANEYLVGMLGQAGVNAAQPWNMASPPYPTDIHWDEWTLGSDAVTPITNNLRLVSAEVEMACAGPYLSTQGTYFGTLAPPDYLYEMTAGDYNTMTIPDILTVPGADQPTINSTPAISVIFRPMQPTIDREFRTIDNLDPESDDYPPAQATMILGASGCGTVATPFVFTMCGNFEGIPSTNAISFIMTLMSFNDPLAIAETDNALQTKNFFVKVSGGRELAASLWNEERRPGVVEVKEPGPKPVAHRHFLPHIQDEMNQLYKTRPTLCVYAALQLHRFTRIDPTPFVEHDLDKPGSFLKFAERFSKPHIVKCPTILPLKTGDKRRLGLTLTSYGNVSRRGTVQATASAPQKSVFEKVIETVVSAAPAVGMAFAKGLL